MIIDNMDILNKKMENFIIKILANCNHIDIIIGSRNQNQFENLSEAKIIKINPLKEIDSVELFKEYAENNSINKNYISGEEYVDLINLDPNSKNILGAIQS